jgi:hypothetical protein
MAKVISKAGKEVTVAVTIRLEVDPENWTAR